jgi:pimeloyl-ACP methyl ester carboxylesterase
MTATEPEPSTTGSHDGTRIAWFSSGDGPPLVLVHGVLGDHSRWDALRPHLEPHHTVHAMDRRGRGASGDADAYDIEREFEDIAAVVDAIAATEGPVDVYGHSGGASYALSAATLTPNLRRLVLYEPALDPAALLPDGLLEHVDELLVAGDPDAVVEMFCRQVLHMDDEAIAAYRAQPSWPARVAAAHTLPRELRSPGTRMFDADRAASVTVPVLLLQGSETPEGFKAALTEIAATFPDARVVELDGQGHTADILAPELVAAELLDFLR